MRLLIIGASGLVGGNLLDCCGEQGIEVRGTHLGHPTERTQLFDPLDPGRAGSLDVEDWAPSVVVHCGALTHVDRCEEEPELSRRLTVESTERVAELCDRLEARLVYLSTDYVFDGRGGPYSEEAETNPLNVYGRHKLEAERLVLAASSPGLVARITAVHGRELRGKNFVARLLEWARSGEERRLRLPSDQSATPVDARDVGRAILAMLEAGTEGIRHLASKDLLTRVEVAERVVARVPGSRVEVEAVPTAELGQAARRPLRGGLLADRFLSEHPGFAFAGLEDYLDRVT